ncbi:uncharacterized protein LOC132040911 [Lycium ferocissimum]|uniref:uncharacterized protein LOC132040911 n=1 Tax=Lycium ferocissimum TaxID=112874 RepID=UPI002816359D|nr:uncharacterized protein LOC132040911 [Lycium ferocissimum]
MRYKAMNNMLQGFYTKQHNKMRGLHIDGLMDYHWDTKLVIIRIDHSWVLKFMARATILALVIVSLPWINTIIGYLSRFQSNDFKVEMANSPINLEFMPIIFQDLANEGLLKMGDRSLLVSDEEEIYNSQVVKDYNPDLISFSDSTQQNVVPNENFDFVFAYGYPHSSNFIERTLKVGGIVVVPLNENPMVDEFPHPSNYKIVYVRKFDSTIVAMKKIKNASSDSSTRRRLFTLATNAEKVSGLSFGNRKLFDGEHFTSLSRPAQSESELVKSVDFEYRTPKAKKITNAKKAALKKLENVLLEPPRAASGKSSRYLKKTHFLPDLMGISLESYPRRVFIDVGLQDKNEKSSDNYYSTWFSKHYPTRNTRFEIFKIETVNEESSGKEVPLTIISMSDWLKDNVQENEYVVMKAEADVVEEMVRNKSIRLIDELFLECKHQGIKKGDKKNRRAYWECLSLYGLLRDEGIAVHQWWG